MIEKVFLSEVLPYVSQCSDDNSGLFGVVYNPELCELPRTWQQSLIQITGVNVVQKRNPYSDFVYWVTGVAEQTQWPGFGSIGWEIDGRTGRFLRHIRAHYNVYSPSWLKASRGDVFLSKYLLTGLASIYYLQSIDPYQDDPGTATLVEEDMSRFVNWDEVFMCFDVPTDIAILRTTGPSGTPASCVSVHRWSTGELLRHIAVCGTPINAHWEPYNRVYVVGEQGEITLVDYVTGEVFSSTQLDLSSVAMTGQIYATSYSPQLRMMVYLSPTPDAADGASTLRLSGYRNTPQAARITSPVPLGRIRAGRDAAFIARVRGTLGESVSGVNVMAQTHDGDGRLVNAVSAVDAGGFVRFNMRGVTQGASAISLSCQVPAPQVTNEDPALAYATNFRICGVLQVGDKLGLRVGEYLYAHTVVPSNYHPSLSSPVVAAELNARAVGEVTGTVTGGITGEVHGVLGGAAVRGVVVGNVFTGTSTGLASGEIDFNIVSETFAPGVLSGTVVSGGATITAVYNSADETLTVSDVPVDPTEASPTSFVPRPRVELVGALN